MVKCNKNRSYGKVINDLASQDPNRIAVYLDNTQDLGINEDIPSNRLTTLSIGELDKRGNQLARVFASKGVGPGDIVTIALPNSIELLVAMLASWRVGAMPNPVSSRMPKVELQHVVDCANPALVVGVDVATLSNNQCLPASFQIDPVIDATPLPDPDPIGGERTLTSSGSTGTPKLIIPTARACYDPATASPLFKPDLGVLVPGPIYHAVPFSATWQGIFSGATVVIMQRFDAACCLALIEEFRVDRLAVVPTMMQRIWRLPKQERLSRDVSSLKFVMSGGAPLAPWLMQAWIDWLGPQVMNEAFGPSERIGGTFINGVEWLEHPGSVGKPMPGCSIKILDKQGNECAADTMGEIYMLPQGGPGSTYQYLGATSNTTTDGWESVGDMGYINADGYLFLGDRRSDMILCGGRNIYPAEIEGEIEAHPLVRSCAVIGLPDEDMGQRIHAIVDCATATVTDVSLVEHLQERLTPYKIPTSFEYINEVLRNDAGKIRRKALREQRINKAK